MKSLPIDTIVKVKGYGIGIIIDELYSSKQKKIILHQIISTGHHLFKQMTT